MDLQNGAIFATKPPEHPLRPSAVPAGSDPQPEVRTISFPSLQGGLLWKRPGNRTLCSAVSPSPVPSTPHDISEIGPRRAGGSTSSCLLLSNTARPWRAHVFFPNTHSWAWWWFPLFGRGEPSCCAHLCSTRCEDMRFPPSLAVFVETEWLGHMLNSCSPLKKLPDSHCVAEAFLFPCPWILWSRGPGFPSQGHP